MYSPLPLDSFLGPTYELDSGFNDQRTINLLVMPSEVPGTKDNQPGFYITAPGRSLFTALPESPVRGLYTASNGSLFVVAGSKLYQIATDGSYTQVADLAGIVETTPVDMIDDGDRLVIVDGPHGWLFQISTQVLTQIKGDAWIGSTFVTYIDSFFVFGAGRQMYFGEDPLNLDPLDNIIMEDTADNIMRIIADHGFMHVQKTRHSISYYNTSNGAAVNLFQPITQSVQEVGCKAKFSMLKAAGRVLYLGEDARGGAVVYGTEGSYQGVRLSTSGIEKILNQSTKLEQTIAWTYHYEGQPYYCLRVPDLTSILCLNLTTKIWTELSNWVNGEWVLPGDAFHAFFDNKHITGDYTSGTLYLMREDQFSRYDPVTSTTVPNRWLRRTGYTSNFGYRAFFNQVQLQLKTATSPSYTDAYQVMLKFSDNQGKTYTSELLGSSGYMGDDIKRVIWRRLGQARHRIWEFTGDCSEKQFLYDVILSIEGGNN